jgi:hypothetical protein
MDVMVMKIRGDCRDADARGGRTQSLHCTRPPRGSSGGGFSEVRQRDKPRGPQEDPSEREQAMRVTLGACRRGCCVGLIVDEEEEGRAVPGAMHVCGTCLSTSVVGIEHGEVDSHCVRLGGPSCLRPRGGAAVMSSGIGMRGRWFGHLR